MNQYKIQIIKVDEELDEYILSEQEVTADEAIEYILQVQSAGQEEEIEEGPEPALPPATSSGRRRRREYDREEMEQDVAAGLLKVKEIAEKHGVSEPTVYSVKKKMKEASKPSEKYKAPSDKPWYFEDVLNMLKDEFGEQEIYNRMSSRITDTQFREAIDWANSEIIQP